MCSDTCWSSLAVHPKTRLIGLEASPFYKLPLELIFLIASYLPLESAAVLSISCYTFYSCFKMKYLQALKEAEYSATNGFLRLLERDFPAHLLCPHCNKLHSMSSPEHHIFSRRYSKGPWYYQRNEPWLACWNVDRKNRIEIGTYLGFSSTIFRMAMKAHRQGHDTTKLLDLLSYGKRDIYELGFVEQRTVAVRIQDGSFLAREQRVFMIPASHKLPVPWYGGIDICPHIQFITMKYFLRYGIKVPYADQIEGYKNRQGIIYCQYCYTEFRVDFKSYRKAGNAMFVTKWIDLGKGRDVSDHAWKSRIASYREKSRTKVVFRRGSICAAFEQKARFRFDSLLTPQDENDLCTKSPWPWPDDVEHSFDGRSYCVIRRGEDGMVRVRKLQCYEMNPISLPRLLKNVHCHCK